MTLTTRVTGLSALLLLAFVAQPCAQQGATYTNRLRFNASAQTVASNGGATAATGTVTLGKSYVELTCSDTDGCTMSLSETGAHSGDVLVIVNVSANTETFADSAGVLELSGGMSASLAQYDSLSVVYRSDRWVQVSRSPLLTATVQLGAVRFPLTNAQIKALPTTALTLVAAPGSGKRIKVLSAAIRIDAAAGAYTNINGTYSAIALYWLGDFTQWATVGMVDDVSATLTRLTALIGGAAIVNADLPSYLDVFSSGWAVPNVVLASGAENTALAIKADNNGSGDYTGGNAANSGMVSVIYAVIG